MNTKGERTKSLILDKAISLFSSKGYNAVTMKDICDETGLSRGGLYRYYGSTAEIMIEIMDREQIIADSGSGQNSPVCMDPVKLLDEFIGYHTWYVQSPIAGLDNAMLQFAMYDPKGKIAHKRRIENVTKRIEDLIRFGQAKDVFNEGDPYEMAFHVTMTLGGLRNIAFASDTDQKRIIKQLNFIRKILLKEQVYKENGYGQHEEEGTSG